MKTRLMWMLTLTLAAGSCEHDRTAATCHIAATIEKIEIEGGCLYYYFRTDQRELLYPEDNVIEELDIALTEMDLSAGQRVNLDYVRHEGAFYLECLITLAPGLPIDITCLSQDDVEAVYF